MKRDTRHIGSSFESWLEAEGIAEEVMMAAAYAEPHSLIGTFRRFGRLGPVYEIIGTAETHTEGRRLMSIRVVETGEELAYPLRSIFEDPKVA